VTLAVPESRRLPESMETALYACGRLLVDTVGATSGPIALTLTVSAEEVQLAVTAPTEGDDVGDNLRKHALRLLRDRLGVLGGALTTASYERITEIRFHVPLTAESKGTDEGGPDTFEHANQTPAQFLPGPGGATTRVKAADSKGIR
jgi:signal transduction histidine kinase